MIFASDLDQTLIYSERSMGDISASELVPVELYQGQYISFMTASAIDKLEALIQTVQFVPVTTRTPEQFNRIFTIKDRFQPEYVIVSNGGTILVNGDTDREWNDRMREAVHTHCANHLEILNLFTQIASDRWVKSTRLCDDWFYSIVVEREHLPEESVAEMRKQLAPLGWSYSLQGRKIYLVPEKVSKGAAIEYVKEKLGSNYVFAAGDSLLDESLLLAADYAIAPCHGELGRMYASHPHIHFTASRGALASEELLDRIHERVRAPFQTNAV
jgi:hydroxymethylpyrimidine pyrophosphatase-like HAD family hydrolase